MTSAVDHKNIILIVDGNCQRAGGIERILKENGYRAVMSASCDEAVEVMHGVHPELIIFNLLLMSTKGYEACKSLKQNSQRHQLPIIVTIENTDDDTLQAAFEAGASDYICYPIKKVELMARIRSALIQQQLLKEQLAEKMAKKRLEQAGVLCHELNQPMQAVMGFSQLLMMDRVMVDSPALKQLSNIYHQVERMGDIIRRLMGVTRLQSKPHLLGAEIKRC
jgi:DNA-binding response OmpR family regulator